MRIMENLAVRPVLNDQAEDISDPVK